MRGTARDFAIDVGSATLRVLSAHAESVVRIPAIAAVDPDGRICARGSRALAVQDRRPDGLRVVRPVAHRAVADTSVAAQLLRTALRDAAPHSRTQTAGGTVCLPDDAGSVQAQALLDVCHGAGLRHVRLVPKSLAAAAGAGIPLDEPAGALLVDVGADRTSAAMLSFGDVISTRGTAVGSATVDTALMRFLRRRHGLVVCAAEAERAKVRIGESLATTGTVPVHGQDLQRGLPDTRNVPAAELARVARDTFEGIARITLSLLADSPAELVDDVVDRGLVLCGEGARLYGLEDHLRERVNIPVHVPDHPGDLGVRGAWQVGTI